MIKRERGMSMVELMVAMVIGLIGMVIIFQVFEVSEGIRRTTTSGGDAQQNGTLALYRIERDLRNAGMGFNDSSVLGCNLVGYDKLRAPTDFPAGGQTLLVVPVRVVPGGSVTVPDSLVVFYGSSTHVTSATTLSAQLSNPASPMLVRNRYGFRTGDLIMLTEPGNLTKSCPLMEVSDLPTGQSDQIVHDDVSYTLSGGGSAAARYNKVGGLGASTYVLGANLYNLGNRHDAGEANMPVHNTFAIDNSRVLNATGLFTNTVSALADNIVHMRALYGLDDGVDNGTVTFSAVKVAGDGIVDRYVDGNTTPNWSRVVAIRVVVVARSALPEKPSVAGGACDTTVVRPSWSGDDWPGGAPWSGAPANLRTMLDLSADANWQCYRYKVFETTVTLRNGIWKAS